MRSQRVKYEWVTNTFLHVCLAELGLRLACIRTSYSAVEVWGGGYTWKLKIFMQTVQQFCVVKWAEGQFAMKCFLCGTVHRTNVLRNTLWERLELIYEQRVNFLADIPISLKYTGTVEETVLFCLFTFWFSDLWCPVSENCGESIKMKFHLILCLANYFNWKE